MKFPKPAAPEPVMAPATEPVPHRVFHTHRDAIELWGIIDDPAVPIATLDEAYTVNDGVDGNGVAQ